MIRRAVIFCGMVLSFFGGFDGNAMFAIYETQQVPIGRLFTNLQARLAKDKNDFELTYDLARLHAMAYSTNLVAFTVRTNNGRPEFYYPGDDSGVPIAVYLPESSEARAEAGTHLTNAIVLFE